MWLSTNMLLVDSFFIQGMQKGMSIIHGIAKTSHG